MISKSILTALLLLVLMIGLAGCGNKKKLIVLLIDNSLSMQNDSQSFVEQFEKSVKGSYGFQASDVLIFSMNTKTTLHFNGKGTQSRSLFEKLKEAAQPCSEIGSDIYTGLVSVNEQLMRFQDREITVIVVSDLKKHDKLDSNGRRVQRYEDPFTFRWSMQVRMLIFGVDADKSAKARAAWNAETYQRGYMFRANLLRE